MYLDVKYYRGFSASDLALKLMDAKERITRAQDEITAIIAVLSEREFDLAGAKIKIGELAGGNGDET